MGITRARNLVQVVGWFFRNGGSILPEKRAGTLVEPLPDGVEVTGLLFGVQGANVFQIRIAELARDFREVKLDVVGLSPTQGFCEVRLENVTMRTGDPLLGPHEGDTHAE